MENPWIVPIWVMLGVMMGLNALMWVTNHTSAWLPVTAMWAFSLVLWGVCAFKAARYKF